MGVAGTGVHVVPDPVPAEQGFSPELSSGPPGSTFNLLGKMVLPGRSWLHPSRWTICYFCQKATGHKYRFLSIFYYLT